METHTFNWDGKSITVQVSKDSGHRFFYVENNNTMDYLVKGFKNSYAAKSVEVEWAQSISDTAQNVIASSAHSYLENGEVRYNQLYNASAFPEAAGDYYGKQCINGVMERTIGCKCFLPDGSFEAPI